jgi:hypothetical protein
MLNFLWCLNIAQFSNLLTNSTSNFVMSNRANDAKYPVDLLTRSVQSSKLLEMSSFPSDSKCPIDLILLYYTDSLTQTQQGTKSAVESKT